MFEGAPSSSKLKGALQVAMDGFLGFMEALCLCRTA